MKQSKALLLCIFTLFCVYVNAQIPELLDQNYSAFQEQIFGYDTQRDVALEFMIDQEIFSVRLEDNNLLSEDFSKQFPFMKTYTIYDSRSSRIIGALTLGDHSLQIMIKGREETKVIKTNSQGRLSLVTKDINDKLICSQNGQSMVSPNKVDVGVTSKITNVLENGKASRTYRMAVVCTGEYYFANGNSDNAVATAITTAVNNLQVIYSTDLNVKFSLLNPRLYNNADTDPFIPEDDGGDNRTVQARTVVSDNFNINNYDIGHVFHHSEPDDGWGSGGVAFLQAVCDNGFNNVTKAGGWSGAFDSQGLSFIQILAHEVGHMFGAEHTFNGEGASCDDAISELTAYEIGSGTTLMSYEGICADDQNIPSVNALNSYFHAHSIVQMVNYMEGEGDCAQMSGEINNIPQVDANPCNIEEWRIPKRTAFILDGSATDEDESDVLTYVWEQYDEDGPGTSTQGFIGTQAGNSGRAPLFKSLPPSTETKRYFPSEESVINGINDPFDVLPRVARDLTFRLTVRDNHLGGGAIAQDELIIDIDNAGPLSITEPNGNENFMTGETVTLEWDINNSEELCDLVNIDLSLDGGITYSINLATEVPYDLETFDYDLPLGLNNTSTARIRITCVDNPCFQFYDVSNNNFTITSECSALSSSICDTELLEVDAGDPALMLDMNYIDGEIFTSFNRTLTGASPVNAIVMNNPSVTGCEQVLSSRSVESFVIQVGEEGTYRFSIDEHYISIFRNANYNGSNPCNSFIGSTGTLVTSGETSAFSSTRVDVELQACTEYRVVMFSYSNNPINVGVTEITGPGIIFTEDNTNTDYAYTYIAINQDNMLIAAQSDDADFTLLPGGLYHVYGMAYKQGGPEPPMNVDITTIIGKSIIDLAIDGNCVLLSDNFKIVDIESTCVITGIELGQPSACNPLDNTYFLEVIVSYEMPAPGDELVVNGSNYPVTSSPQTILLEGLISNGNNLSVVASFQDNPTCFFSVTTTSQEPENCCPIVVDLGTEIFECIGTPVVLDAGPDGATYVWFREGTPLTDSGSTIEIEESGNYTVQVTNSDGCTKPDAVSVTFQDKPDLVTIDSRTICNNEVYSISIITDGTDIEIFRNEVSFATDVNMFDISQDGDYKVVSKNEAGCESEVSFTVTVNPAPVVELGDAQEACMGQEVILDAGTDGSEYTWELSGQGTLPEVSSMLMPVESGLYLVTVTNDLDCITTDQVQVDFIDAPTVTFLIDEESISFCAPGEVELGIENTDVEIVWRLDGIVFTPSGDNTHLATQGGTYSISGENDIGCTSEDEIIVNALETPTVELGENIIACIGSTVTINPMVTAEFYEWRSAGQSDIISTDQILEITDSGIYELTVINGSDCSSADIITVSFVPGPTLEITGDFSFCSDGQGALVAETNGTEIQWLLDGNLIQGESDFTLEISDSGQYSAIVTGDTDCEVMDVVNVEVFDLPEFELGGDVEICIGFTHQLIPDTGVPGDTYAYFLNSVNLNIDENISTLEITDPGMYEVVVTSANNCANTESIELTVFDTPSLELEGSNSLCLGSDSEITATSNGANFEWFLDGDMLTENSNTLSISEGGEYTCVAYSSEGCSSTQIFNVMSVDAPVIDLGDDISLCPNESITLDAGNHIIYDWSTGEMTATIEIVAPSSDLASTETISVTVDDNGSCTTTDEIIVNYLPTISGDISSDQLGICEGGDITLTASGGLVYSWDNSDGTLSTDEGAEVIATPLAASSYTVTITDICPDNEAIVSFDVPIFTGENVSAGEDTCIVLGNTYELMPVGGVSYSWTDDGTFLSATTIGNAVVQPEETTEYELSIIDLNGCAYFDNIEVCVVDDPLSIFKAISIISPNGDGMNDQLLFPGLDSFTDNKITIFNRWGNVVYEKEGYQLDGILWDGTDGGSRLPADTYYYVLTFETYSFKSSITLVYE